MKALSSRCRYLGDCRLYRIFAILFFAAAVPKHFLGPALAPTWCNNDTVVSALCAPSLISGKGSFSPAQKRWGCRRDTRSVTELDGFSDHRLLGQTSGRFQTTDAVPWTWC